MKVSVVHNRDRSGVINVLGIQNQEAYDPVTVEAVARALEHGGHIVRVIDGNMHVIEQLRDFMPAVMSGERPGMVFNMAYGIQGVSRYTHLPGMLEMLGVPYVGSGPQAHSLALDKVIAKLLFQGAGVPTPGFWNFARPDDRFEDLRFPAIVKPKMEAMSSGIRIVKDEQELREAVAEIIERFQQHVLVEEFVPGREFTVGLLGNADDLEALPVVELDLEGDPMGIRADEVARPRRKICPARLPEEKRQQLQQIARDAFKAVGLSDFGRIDVRMDADGNPYVLEINSMADLGQEGSYVCGAAAAGYSYDALINRVLSVAAVRYFGADAVELPSQRGRGTEGSDTRARVRSFLRSHATTIEDGLRATGEMTRLEQVVDRLGIQLRELGFGEGTRGEDQDSELLRFANHQDAESDAQLLITLDRPGAHSHGLNVDGSHFEGGGVLGTRGAIAVLLAALRALRHIRALRRCRLEVIVSPEPAGLAKRSRRELETRSRHARVVLGLAPGEPGGGLVLQRAGRAAYRVELTAGRSRKVAGASQTVAAFCQCVLSVHKLAKRGSNLRVDLPLLQVSASGDAAPEASAELILRFMDDGVGRPLDHRVRELLKPPAGKGVRLLVEGGVECLALVETDSSRRLFEEVRKIARSLHIALPPGSSWCASPMGYLASKVPALDGFGPVRAQSDGGHTAVRHSLVDRAALLALTIAAGGAPS